MMQDAIIGGKKKFLRGDWQIWLIVIILGLISIIEVYSSSAGLAYRNNGGDTEAILFRHIFLVCMGVGMVFFFQMIPTRRYISWANILMVAALILLAYTLMHGLELNQGKRWTRIFGISIQPSELAKIPMVIFVAVWLSKYQDKLRSQDGLRDFVYGLLPVVGVIGLGAALIFPENLSTAVLFAGTGFTMLALGNVRWGHLLFLGGTVLILFAGAAFIMLKMSGDSSRATTWVNRLERFSSESSFQAQQAKIAVASGLIWGKGPGKSTQRFILPHSYDDCIYATTIEEGGLIAGVLVMAMYLWLLLRVRVIVLRSKNPYHVYLCTGLVIMIAMQAFLHMFISVGLFPISGQPLPFVSKGGTSIVMTGVALGLIQSVARHQRKEEYEGEKRDV